MNNNVKFGFLILLFILSFSVIDVYAAGDPNYIYEGEYSIKDMLQNYSVVTFGKKDLDSRMTQSDFSKGDERIFHINGQFLVNGVLKKVLYNSRIDLRGSNSKYNSFYRSKEGVKEFFCGYCEAPNPMTAPSSAFYYGCNSEDSKIYSEDGTSFDFVGPASFKITKESITGNYIDFNRLYDSIVEQQNNIYKGRMLDASENTLHINIGGEYYIDDISNVKDIIFDNFDKNENELTVITVNNSEITKFPQLFRSDDSSNYNIIPTNDYIGMAKPNYDYARYYVIDTYYGNIIWNFPNANYIRIDSGVPLVGHIIAPKADIEGTTSFQVAGAILANSIYFSGSNEVHFYPLVNTNIPYRSNSNPVKAKLNIPENKVNIKFNNGIDKESLEEGMVVSFTVENTSNDLFTGIEIKDKNGKNVEFKRIGDNEYEFVMPSTDVTITPKFKEKNIKNTVEQILTNPKTGSNVILVLGIVILSSILGFVSIKKKKID